MIKINLVPKEILNKARQKQIARQAAAAGVAALLVLGGISVSHYLTLRRLQAQTAVDNQKLKELQDIVSKVEQMQKEEAAIRSRLEVISSLLKSRPLYPYFMSDFAKSVPDGIQVQSLSTAGGGSAGSPLHISLSAQARNNDDIAAWINGMQGSGRFSAIVLGGVTAQGTQSSRSYKFSLNSTYTPSL